MNELNKLSIKWTTKELEECLFFQNFVKNKDLKFENQLLVCIWLNSLAKNLYEKAELKKDHYSYKFLNTNKKTIMDILNAKRYKIDLGLRYLEGAQLINIKRMNELSFELSNIGNRYISTYLNTSNGKSVYENILTKGERYEQ